MIDIRKGTVISAKFSDGTVIRDFSKGILPGTARTLDMANGAVKLERGILSRSGGSMLDDSSSLIIDGEAGSYQVNGDQLIITNPIGETMTLTRTSSAAPVAPVAPVFTLLQLIFSVVFTGAVTGTDNVPLC